MLFYVCKAPPNYDQSLNKEVIKILEKSPLFLLSFGFWQLTNMHLLPYKDYPLRPEEKLFDQRYEEHVISLYSSISAIRKYSGPA